MERKWRKIDPEKLRAYVSEHPDAFLEEIGEVFECSGEAIRLALKKLKIRKKNETVQQGVGGIKAMEINEMLLQTGRAIKMESDIMTAAFTLKDVVTIVGIAAAFTAGLTGVIVWVFSHWKDYKNLKTGMRYRQGDIVMIFSCLRVLLESAIGMHDDAKEPLSETLKDLNRHMEARTGGLDTRSKV